jgi:hypothetical protein
MRAGSITEVFAQPRLRLAEVSPAMPGSLFTFNCMSLSTESTPALRSAPGEQWFKQ